MNDYKIRAIECNFHYFGSDKCLHKEKTVSMYTDYIYKHFNMEDVKHNIDDIGVLLILHYNDNFYIFQAGGYSPDEGLFTEMIDLSKYNITR